jgi:hypothetical protein
MDSSTAHSTSTKQHVPRLDYLDCRINRVPYLLLRDWCIGQNSVCTDKVDDWETCA